MSQSSLALFTYKDLLLLCSAMQCNASVSRLKTSNFLYEFHNFNIAQFRTVVPRIGIPIVKPNTSPFFILMVEGSWTVPCTPCAP